MRPISRRECLTMLSSAGLALALPSLLPRLLTAAGNPPSPGAGTRWDRTLILLELNGGNDGLNFVVPYTEPSYYKARPRIGVPRDQVLQLSESLGFNPALAPLMQSWKDRDLAIVLGVGYEHPNRSHFRSIDIWNTATDAEVVLTDGWIAQLFKGTPPPDSLMADGMILGRNNTGPLAGPDMRNLMMRNPDQFIRAARIVRRIDASATNPALERILKAQREIREAAEVLERKLKTAPLIKTVFPKSPLGQELQTCARILAAGIPIPVIKVSHGSFDTHGNQVPTQTRLLKELGEALAAFKKAMVEVGRWDGVLIQTYAEFGRRVAENASAGTDHGTAAPHLLMGGKVKGGFHGKQPSLTDLQAGDLKFAVDYRAIYRNIAQSWWHMADQGIGARFPALDCIG